MKKNKIVWECDNCFHEEESGVDSELYHSLWLGMSDFERSLHSEDPEYHFCCLGCLSNWVHGKMNGAT